MLLLFHGGYECVLLLGHSGYGCVIIRSCGYGCMLLLGHVVMDVCYY